jgi:hypothetical protein
LVVRSEIAQRITKFRRQVLTAAEQMGLSTRPK